MCGSSFENAVGVRDGTSRVIVEMILDVTAYDFEQGVDLIEDFSRCSRAILTTILAVATSALVTAADAIRQNVACMMGYISQHLT